MSKVADDLIRQAQLTSLGRITLDRVNLESMGHRYDRDASEDKAVLKVTSDKIDITTLAEKNI